MQYSQLVWRSRRGMLELDLALSDFVKYQYPALPKHLQHAYESLLQCEDPYLYQSIVLGATCRNEHIEIVQTIRNAISPCT